MLRLKQTMKHARLLSSPTQSNLMAFNNLSLRSFALFQGKSSTHDQRNAYHNIEEQRTQDQILRSIDHHKKNIANKTQKGFTLSKSISESVEQDKYKKIQRYEIFINKMHQLYKSEIRFQQKTKKKLQIQRNSILYSQTPLKDILREYNNLTTRGFNSEATVKTLQNIQNTIRARGYQARVMEDYSIIELDQSWRMQKLVDDIQFGLRKDQFFNPLHMAQTSNQLGDLGYKNTSLIPLFFEKLQSQIDERQSGSLEATSLDFQDAVYGGPKNFLPRHYIFKGFQNSDEFNQYLEILTNWESEGKTAQKTKQHLNDEANALEKTIAEVINSALQVKELQKDYQASIESLRGQYFQMLEASDKHQFLQENQYIKYDLLELQELLVKGGYIEPEEANKHLNQEPFDQKMERAAQVFYDYVFNYAPELLSPQHQHFYEAAVNSVPTSSQNDNNAPLEKLENSNLINISSLSQTLVGLSNQVLSFRRDVQGQDYLNKFYEQYLMPLEQKIHGGDQKEYDRLKYETIMMERSYLKGWQIFKAETAKLLPRFKELVREDKDQLSGQLDALNALGACRLDEAELRTQIIKNALKALEKKGTNISQVHVVNGLKGLALSTSVSEEGKQLGAQLAERIVVPTLTFEQLIDYMWSLSALKLYEAKSLKRATKMLNEMNFESLDHDMKYDEYMKLLDIHNGLRFEAPKNLQITNKGLLMGLNGKDMYLNLRFKENLTKYDPFKQRVVQALAKGLTDASIDHQVILENELYQAQALDADVLNHEKYPYKPDVLMGYKGSKIGVFILPETETTLDTKKANGSNNFRMRILEAANSTVKTAAIAVNKVVEYDIEGLKVSINKDFNFQKSLEEQVEITNRKAIDFTDFNDFGLKLIQRLPELLEELPASNKDQQMLNAYINKLHQIVVLRQQSDLRFEESQRSAGYDQLKYQLMQLDLIYSSLSKQSQEYLQNLLNPLNQAKSVKDLLLQVLNSIPEIQSTEINNKDVDRNWLGTRLEVELPVNAKSEVKTQKSIVPEIINQRFMWVDDYFHYDDWQLKQKQTFDNFNLIVVPANEKGHKFFFDKDQNNRRIPQGVFPNPNYKRQIMLPTSNSTAQKLLGNKNHDEYVLFEKEPYKMMVINELKKAETLLPIDQDTSMITNLQNIKQGLKSNYTDKEILNTILLNLNFTDQLIEEHLKPHQVKPKQAKYLPRNSSEYRRFVQETYYSKDREDPYTHFYLGEAAKKERIVKMVEEEKQVQQETEEETKDMRLIEEGNKRREVLQDKVDRLLLQMEMENEDFINLSSQLKQNVKVNYDLKSLVKSEFIYDVDPDLINKGLSDDDYLNIQRRRAESKLIKTKIIYKLYQAGQELTQNEKLYLKKWIQNIRQDKSRNLFNIRDSMLPENPTQLTFGDIEAKNFYTLNSISKVHVDRDKHGQYSLNDLVVELCHFFDEEVVNKVETEVFSERMKQEWKLSKDFKVVETRNKEIGLVINELEEVAWRSAGMLNDKDMDYLKRMMSIKRNKDSFDKQFYDTDMRSFKQFVDAVNVYDDRVALIEKWAVRKEDEFQQRVNVPPEHLKKSDEELFREIDAPLKRARQRLVSKLLIADFDGNPIQKEYKDITSRELHTLTENLSLRLYLFNYEYPSFLPQAVRGIMDHPNLLKSDKDQLDIYCKMFELDWRGDRNYEAKQEFMSQSPIYVEGDNIKAYGEVTEEVVKDKLKSACASYVEEVSAKLINLS